MDSIDDAGLAEAEADNKERELNNVIKIVRDCPSKPDLNRHSEYIEAARLAYWLLNLTAQGDDVPAYFNEEKLNGIALGQVIMEHTDPEQGRNNHMTMHDKRLWFDAAEHMGPDYAQGMYHAAVFVSKVA